MQYQLTLSAGAIEQLQRDHSGELPQVTRYETGLCRLPKRVEWLVGETLRPANDQESSPQLVAVCGDHSEFLEAEFERQKTSLPDAPPTVLLALGTGRSSGKVGAACKLNRPVGIDLIKIVMPGLPCITFDPQGGRPMDGVLKQTRENELSTSQETRSFPWQEIWSRTIGALGEEVFRRITELHVAVVGCGRSGSQLAAALSRLGIMQITLIDPDQVELHNIGEMTAVTTAEVGCNKAEAVARHLGRFGPVTGYPDSVPLLHAVPESILSLPGLIAAKQADVLFCCVDDAAARVATAFIATLYLRPLIDVGTGITIADVSDESATSPANSMRPQMGADVRLLVPGDRCLMCLGGVSGFEEARRTLLSGSAAPVDGDWQRQRAGSLYSLNGIAIQLAMRLFEDFLSARIEQSTWLRMNIASPAEPSLQRLTPARSQDCEFCSVNGRGDAGVRDLSRILVAL